MSVIMKSHFFTYFLLFLLILGSVAQSSAATEAEASIGESRSTFGMYDVSDMSDDERDWFFTFLKGTFFCDGWELISSEILMNTLADEREQQQRRLDNLGYKIGREWSKGNDKRKIHTTMLRKWGSELKDTAEESPYLLTEVLERIDQEVDELLD